MPSQNDRRYLYTSLVRGSTTDSRRAAAAIRYWQAVESGELPGRTYARRQLALARKLLQATTEDGDGSPG